MASSFRQLAKTLLPARGLHAYRVLRHIVLAPAEPEIALIPRYLSRDAIAVDVGANVGLYASVMARHSLRVLAFEPHPDCAAYLRKLELSGCEVIEAAVSDEEGHAMLRVPDVGHGENPALSTLAASNNFGGRNTATTERAISVPTVRLDDALTRYLPSNGRVSLIKIDVEGHEAAVLRGAGKTLQSHKPALLVEIEARHGGDVDGLFAMLAAIDYNARFLAGDGTLRPIDASSLRRFQTPELLAQKRSRPRDQGYVNNVIFLPRGQQD